MARARPGSTSRRQNGPKVEEPKVEQERRPIVAVAWIREHLPVALTLAAFALAVLRVGSAAGGQPTIQAELLNTLSIQPFLMSVFSLLVPLALFVGVLLLPLRMPFIQNPGTATMASDLPSGVAGVVCLAVLPLHYAIGALLAFVAVGVYRRSKRKRLRELAAFGLGVIALSLVSAVLVSSEMWLPPQAIRLASEKTARTAYVLAEADSGYLTLLYDKPREIARVRGSDVAERFFCTLHERNWLTRPLAASRLPESVAPPACPAGPS